MEKLRWKVQGVVMAVKKAQQSRRLPSAQQDKTKGKEREVKVPPFKNPN